MSLLSQQLTDISGVGASLAQKLSKLDILTVKDILYHFPFRYQDFSVISPIADVREGDTATVFGLIEKVSVRRTWKRKMWLVEITITDETGSLRAVWFNQKYLAAVFKEGMGINLAGTILTDGKKMYLSNPVYEIISKSLEHTRHTGRIVPVYPETRGITSKAIRLVLSKIIDRLDEVDEFLPETIIQKYNLPHLAHAFRSIHFPSSLEDADHALNRFAFQDLFLLQLLKTSHKYEQKKHRAHAIKQDKTYTKKLIENIPFSLTEAQTKTLEEIFNDLSNPHPTSRLLQGDVGSGKTVVAALAALLVAHRGYQSVFMAPTEVLAWQHYRAFSSLFGTLDHGVALLTSSQSRLTFGDNLETTLSKKELLEKIKSGSVSIIIGTQSVIQKNVSFKDAALVIIDEQHRFGVRQRATLSDTMHGAFPHLLSMSATPIPRTLALTVFGDLELSVIDELPKNRKKIITKIVTPSQRQHAYRFVDEQIDAGRQCFVICPRIEPPDPEQPLTPRQKTMLEVRSVTEEYEKLSKHIFPSRQVAMLHGRLKAKEKTAIMERFKNKEFDILVSTSVVEVGVDIPNASIMLIEGSEFFGLAQLYQFRGRVGRGEHQSYCFLFTDSRSALTKERLNALITAKNGFELAEIDLRLRGPGQFLGHEQTGIPDLAMKSLQNPNLVTNARKEAILLLEKNPSLEEHPYLATYLQLFGQQIHEE